MERHYEEKKTSRQIVIESIRQIDRCEHKIQRETRESQIKRKQK